MPAIRPPRNEAVAAQHSQPLPLSTVRDLRKKAPIEPTAERTPVRTPVRPYARTGFKRTITRYAFEFYQDQIQSLRKFSLEEKAREEKGSMSEMVREAVDAYIAKRNRSEE
jgi:hypothetical protein